MQDSYILTFLRSTMGKLFTPIFDYIYLHPKEVTSILAIWLAVYLIALFQLKRVKEQTVILCLNETKEILKKRPNLTTKGLFKEIYPKWEKEVSSYAKFIPHRLDFYPVRVTPENVLKKFDFSPEWLAEALKLNGVDLPEFSKK